MSKTARLYQDTRAANAAGGSGLDRLNNDLQDVTRIMTKNMEELLGRGDSLDRASFYSNFLSRSEPLDVTCPTQECPIYRRHFALNQKSTAGLPGI